MIVRKWVLATWNETGEYGLICQVAGGLWDNSVNNLFSTLFLFLSCFGHVRCIWRCLFSKHIKRTITALTKKNLLIYLHFRIWHLQMLYLLKKSVEVLIAVHFVNLTWTPVIFSNIFMKTIYFCWLLQISPVTYIITKNSKYGISRYSPTFCHFTKKIIKLIGSKCMITGSK